MRLIDADKLNLWTALRPYCSSDVCCEVTDVIKNAPTVNPYEWISVEDRLPEETQGFLVVLNGEDIDIRLFNSKKEPYQTWSSMLNKFLVLTNRREWTSDDNVTHWMPLPAPPTEKEN